VLVEVALIVTPFDDGMTVEKELLRSDWRPPARALLLAMPVTLALVESGMNDGLALPVVWCCSPTAWPTSRTATA
jgi:NhaP-type Na+/H+ or K+/H+ antiporter